MSTSSPHRFRGATTIPWPCLRRLRVALAAGLTLLGCDDEGSPYADDTVAACVADNHPDDGHGWESDEGPCPSGPPGSPPSECPETTPGSIAEQCMAEGVACDPDAFITRDAAMCVARANELAEGLTPWQVGLVFNVGVMRPVWSVRNTTQSDPSDCREEGDAFLIDAETGELLERLHWLGIC